MSKKTILLVDDDSSLRQVLRTVLETEYDYEVIEVPDGTTAITILSSQKPDNISAAILDIIMTHHGGLVADYLRKRPEHNKTLIIYYSALDKDQFDNKILEGAFYVHKEPGSVKKIVELLKKYLEE